MQLYSHGCHQYASRNCINYCSNVKYRSLNLKDLMCPSEHLKKNGRHFHSQTEHLKENDTESKETMDKYKTCLRQANSPLFI